MTTITSVPRVCDHCHEPMPSTKRAGARYCSPRCSKAAADKRRNSKPEVKAQRRDRDRAKAGVDPKDYRTGDTASVAARFGLEATEVVDTYVPAHDGDF